jgi:hypothetical protein
MTTDTEKALLDWDNEERDICNDLHEHFAAFGRWDYTEVADEARRVWNLMFDADIEKGSPSNGVFSACAAQASHGAFSSVAAALGVDVMALKCVVEEWYEKQDKLPPPVSKDRFMTLLTEMKAWIDGRIDAAPSAHRAIPPGDSGGPA